ncbi:MAG TPA: hypothetical protein P5555_08790 [Candidatus Paceibacterota bacterium]|nr:hypothetical protein [Verrucomicrobiota bacterium]HRZ45270.1 hypothetical protein [Candidatus Paceibacterota bacterium]
MTAQTGRPTTQSTTESALDWPSLIPPSFKRNVGRRSLRLFIASLALSAILSFALWLFKDAVFALAGGAPASDRSPITIPTDPSTAAFWAHKLLYEGIVTYSIIAAILTSVFYSIGLVLLKLIPSFYHLEKDLNRFQQRIEAATPNEIHSLLSLVRQDPDAVQPDGRLMARLSMLERAYVLLRTRRHVKEANEHLSAVDQACAAYVLQPLVYLEWILPILGFIGTVWGVTAAVDGLREGIDVLFRHQELTQDVLSQFQRGFAGLVLAFDTTLFGLLGLGFTGTIHFFLRKSASYVLLSIDKWCNEAINLLQERPDPLETLERLLRVGLFETDDDEEVVSGEDGKPVLRVRAWLEALEKLVKAGFFETNHEGELSAAEDGKPIPRAKAWFDTLTKLIQTGFFVTDRQGQPLVGEDGHPILRWQEWMNLTLGELFVTDASGNLRLSPSGQPVSKWASWRPQVLRILLQEFYEVTDKQAEAIAQGELAGTGELVPLRSRHERRHHDLLVRLAFMAYLLERGNELEGQTNELLKTADRSGPKPPVPPPALLVLEPCGLPVDALATTSVRFAVARQAAPSDQGIFSIWTGTFLPQMGGRYRQPVPQDQVSTPERTTGLCGLGDRLAYLCEKSGEIAVRGWAVDEFPEQCSLQGGFLPVQGALGIIPYQKLQQLIVGVQGATEARLLAWSADGLGPPPAPVACLRDTLTVFAARPGYAVACVAGGDKGYRLHLLRDSAPVEFAINLDVAAMAFAPNGALWFIEENGTVGTFSLNTSEPELRFKLPQKASLLAVLAQGQIVAARRNEPELLLLDPAEPSQIRAVPCAAPITALATSPEGENLLLGHQDGSVYYIDTRNRV